MYQIVCKMKTDKEWQVEKFITGGLPYSNIKSAQRDKKKLNSMTCMMNYKVIKEVKQ